MVVSSHMGLGNGTHVYLEEEPWLLIANLYLQPSKRLFFVCVTRFHSCSLSWLGNCCVDEAEDFFLFLFLIFIKNLLAQSFLILHSYFT